MSGSVNASSTAPTQASKPHGPAADAVERAVPAKGISGLGDEHLALRRLLLGDGIKRAWYTSHVKR